METSSVLRSADVDVAERNYSAWLELEVGLDSHSIAVPWKERKKLFAQRVEACLNSLDQTAPGLRAKLEVHPARPFAFTGSLTADDIRAIWPLPELRMLSDRSATDQPTPDASGRLPLAVDVLWHVQAEDSAVVEVEQVTVIVRAVDEEEAKRIAVAECSTMPAHFMGSDYRICRRWWTAERAYLNKFYDEERMRHGTAIVVDQATKPMLKDQPKWRPDASIERVANGSPKQRPETWEWMLTQL